MLYREPKLLKYVAATILSAEQSAVSVLYREPKLLKSALRVAVQRNDDRFSALP